MQIKKNVLYLQSLRTKFFNLIKLWFFKMDTKTKGDIAEIEVQLKALKLGWEVLLPIGDRLPYDLVIVINNKFIKIQVKSAWLSEKDGVYLIDVRRTKTNRRVMKREKYNDDDFDFAIIFIQDLNVFYVMPINIFNSFAGSITLHENVSRQRKPKSYVYREAWDLLEKQDCGIVAVGSSPGS